jgi:plastocyanin
VIVRTALAGLAIVVMATACGGDDDSSDGAAATTVAPATTMAMSAPTTAGAATATTVAAADSAAPMAVTVDIKDFKFVDADIKVAVGGTVTWTNSDTQQHTATAAGKFDTGPIKPGESKTVTFDEAGAIPYACSFHPFMTGTVTVG